MSFPSIHDAYGGFGQKHEKPIKIQESNTIHEINEQQFPPQGKKEAIEKDSRKYPSDASNSSYPVTIRCPKCHNAAITRMNSQMGAAAWVWCVLLAPFACIGISCLCLESCRDKIHFCTRCGHIVGKKFAKVC